MGYRATTKIGEWNKGNILASYFCCEERIGTFSFVFEDEENIEFKEQPRPQSHCFYRNSR